MRGAQEKLRHRDPESVPREVREKPVRHNCAFSRQEGDSLTRLRRLDSPCTVMAPGNFTTLSAREQKLRRWQ